MEALPQEIIGKIVTYVLTSEKWDSMRQDHWFRPLHSTDLELWHRLVHADFKNRSTSRECAPEGFPTVTSLFSGANENEIDNAKALYRASLISHKWYRSVQSFMQKHRILTVDLDRPQTVRDGIALINAGEVSKNLVILAGERHTRPTWRWHGDHPYDVEATLADFWDEPYHLDNTRGNMTWPHAFLRTLPRSARDGEPEDKRCNDDVLSSAQRATLLAEFLQACHTRHFEESMSRKSVIDNLTIKFPENTSWTNLEGPCRQGTGRYDLNAVESVLRSLQATLFNKFATDLRVSGGGLCDHIVDLRLELPCTQHFGILFPSESQGSLRRSLFPSLKSLYIKVTDASGPSGSAEYVALDHSSGHGYSNHQANPLDGTTVELDETEYMTSNLQIELPNRDHQDDLWRFVADCRSIESLHIRATHFLGLDRLVKMIRENVAREENYRNDPLKRDWTRTGLKNLSLSRIYTNTESLIYLLSPEHSIIRSEENIFFDGPPSNIKRLNLNDVKLYTSQDFWADLFEFLLPLRCPHFELLGIYHLTYFQAHRSSQNPVNTMYTNAALFSESWWDWSQLRKLLESNTNIMIQGEDNRMWGARYFVQRELTPLPK